MNEILKQKMDELRRLAQSGGRGVGKVSESPLPYGLKDSLSLGIRNSKEAEVFLAELEAAISQAG